MTEISDVYAKALYKEGMSGDEIEKCRDTLLNNKKLFECLCSPGVTKSEKHRLTKGFFSGSLERFLNVVCDNERMEMIFEIFDSYKKISLDKMGIGTAQLYYVSKPSDEQINAVKKALCLIEGKKDFNIELKKDLSLIGGIVVKSGGKTYNRSVKNSLDALKAKLTGEVSQ